MGDERHEAESARALVQKAIEIRGAEPVARLLGVPRGSLLAFLTGTARKGTALLIETRVRAVTSSDLVTKNR